VERSDEGAATLAGSEMALDYSSGWRETARSATAVAKPATDEGTMIDFRGYAYTRTVSLISGALVTVYDSKTPQTWRRSIARPRQADPAGHRAFRVHRSAAYAQTLAAKFDLHGIRYERMKRCVEKGCVEAFRASKVTFSPVPFEGVFALRWKAHGKPGTSRSGAIR